MTAPLAKYGIYEFAIGERQESEQQQDEPSHGAILPVIRLPMRLGFGSVHGVNRFTLSRIKWTILATRASEAVAAANEDRHNSNIARRRIPRLVAIRDRNAKIDSTVRQRTNPSDRMR
jgi:hypothetical protein